MNYLPIHLLFAFTHHTLQLKKGLSKKKMYCIIFNEKINHKILHLTEKIKVTILPLHIPHTAAGSASWCTLYQGTVPKCTVDCYHHLHRPSATRMHNKCHLLHANHSISCGIFQKTFISISTSLLLIVKNLMTMLKILMR